MPTITRQQALETLLSPITWLPSTSIEYRKALISRRHRDVALIYPFLTPSEQGRATEWQIREAHAGLWD
jgi:hypothetical protein